MIDAKKKLLGGATLLASIVALASCDSFNALPNNYNDAIINNEDGQKTEVYNNIFAEIYDQIALGKTDRILDEFMYLIAEDQFGSYSELSALFSGQNIDTTAVSSYAREHANIFVKEGDAALIENASYAITEDELLTQRVTNFYNRIQERINEHFYNEISGGSYSDRSMFYEIRLARSYYSNLYDIDMTHDDWYVGYLTPSFSCEDVSMFIHFDYFADYINRELVPNIYRELLVEEFLYNDYYSSLGRAYGRNVDIVNLTSDTTFTQGGVNLTTAANQLLYEFSDEYILDQQDPNAEVDFEIVANAWRGIVGINSDGTIIELTQDEKNLLDAAGFLTSTAKVDVDNDGTEEKITYYPATQYGILLDEYLLIDESNRFASEAANSALANFTNNNAYPKEVGLAIKTAELALKDYTIDGWYVRQDGLTDLPEGIRNRLFNINVSSELDNFTEDEMETYDNHSYDPDNYVRYINNNYYLTPAVSESADINLHNFVIYEGGSSYIVKVNEAVSTSKLTINNSHSYYNLKADNVLFTEEVAYEIANVLGTRDAYINSAYESYIESYTLTYHDSDIYDYFVSQFPDLFED